MKQEYPTEVRKWDVFEVAVEGPSEGNPFTEQKVQGMFSSKNESVVVDGFYDGDGNYRVRFMPSYTGRYTFVVMGTFLEEKAVGVFYVQENDESNHGPVRVVNTHHFAYEDGTPYISIGTTAYVWALQSEERIRETLDSLEEAGFNKMRFCILPKHYAYNLNEPSSYPYEGTPMDSSVLNDDNFMEYMWKKEGNNFDLTRFNPEHFRRIEFCIEELAKRGIEADLIVMHPYDRWGFSSMSREEDDLYWNYVIARFSAYHNVWWALANEFDLMQAKKLEDWEHYADLLVRKDPYRHLRSIHNCRIMYDHSRPWITHCSVQRVDLYKGAELTGELALRYGKPVVMDEIAYEGNIQHGWGNITGEEMVRRFWETAVRGGYPGHGETYMNDENVLWWSHGGKLRGESWKRVRFLHDILAAVPGNGLVQADMEWDSVCGVPESEWIAPVKSQYLFYYSFMRPSFREFHIDDETEFVAEVIDTWNMTIRKAGIFSGKFRVELPARQYMAIRLRTPTEEDRLHPVDEEPEEEIVEEVPVQEEELPEVTEEEPGEGADPELVEEEIVFDLGGDEEEDEEPEEEAEDVMDDTQELQTVREEQVLVEEDIPEIDEDEDEDPLPPIVTEEIPVFSRYARRHPSEEPENDTSTLNIMLMGNDDDEE